MDYKNYNPRAAALAQARTLLTDAVKAAVADGTLPEAAHVRPLHSCTFVGGGVPDAPRADASIGPYTQFITARS